MSAEIRIGIVGTGGIGYMHADGVKKAKGLTLQAACDNDAQRLKDFAHHFQITQSYTNFEQMLADRHIDAVLILAPHHLHEPMGTAAMRAGKHVLIEKPIARTVAEADRMIAEAQRAGVTLMVGHNQRYYPSQRCAKEMIGGGAIGRIVLAEGSHYQNFRPKSAWWRLKEPVGGGAVISSGIHLLDLMRWSVGEVESVFATAAYDAQRLEGEVAASVALKFKNGATGAFHIHWGLTLSRGYETFAVYGTEGHVARKTENILAVKLPNQEPNELSLTDSAYPSMWEHFGECIRNGTQPLTSGAEGRASLALVEAIHRSIDTAKMQHVI